MKKLLPIVITLSLLLVSCNSNTSNNSKHNEQDKYKMIKGKWKSTTRDKDFSISQVTEYFDENGFKQTGSLSFDEPKVNFDFEAIGKFYLTDTIISFAYDNFNIYNCVPKSSEKEMKDYFGESSMETGAYRLLLLNNNTMIQESDDKLKTTFIKIID
jgi:hypothetical protein